MRADLKEWMLKTSEELQGLGSKVLLWTNESPFSEFGAQTILTGNVLQGYDAIEIESYGYVTNSSNRQTTLPIIIHIDETGCMQSGAFGGTNYASGVFWFATRKVTPSSSGIVFDNAYGGYPNNNWAMRNDMCVPYRIYGLKFGATGGGSGGGTSDYEDLENKPTINGVTLVEGLVTEDLNLGDTAHEEITQADFDALTSEEQNDGTVYFITDGIASNVFVDDNVPVGTIAPYGGSNDPAYWLICDGRAISRTAYSELFSVIGTTYGTGDGSTTFNLPDLKGRVPMGAGSISAQEANTTDGTAAITAGAINKSIGDKGGEIKHTVSVNEMPSHTHTMLYYTSGATAATWGYNYTNGAGTRSGQTEASGGIGPTGGGQAHNNMQPYVVTNYIIKAKTALSENQSQLDFFYPVGSYYETSDATFDPNIRWGGTWEKVESGRFLQATTDNTKVGDVVEAGLPNITGGFTARTTNYNTSPIIYPTNGTNAFSYQSGGGSGDGIYQVNGVQNWYTYTFDASRSSSIYGESTTVQPPAILVTIWHRVT